MSIRKHLAGVALFSLILGSAIFINHFLTLPRATIPDCQTQLFIAGVRESPNFTYQVRQVSLDFAGATGYTSLRLKLHTGQAAPEAIWVRTYYSSPGIAGSEWSGTTEIRRPFVSGDEVELVATNVWERDKPLNTHGASYFARVEVSSWPPTPGFSRDVLTAIPVVVHWPDE